MVLRPCPGSGGRRCPINAFVTSGRCSACRPVENKRQHSDQYDAAWRKLSKRVIADWVREHGPWCPGQGSEHDAHPSFDLTLDHGDQAGLPGRLVDRSRLRVMCRSWNSVLGRR